MLLKAIKATKETRLHVNYQMTSKTITINYIYASTKNENGLDEDLLRSPLDIM